jgi:acetolactate synthase I/II/III large subunit
MPVQWHPVSDISGAHAILQTLVQGGVTACFTNPGTSEMHLVAGLDAVPELRGVLCLFEGVATGAADGYGRMAGRPASTLLHLGPGLANGLANLHNARRAGTPIVNLVGDHATYHKHLDAPLESDIDAMAGAVSRWVHRTAGATTAGEDTAAAIAAAGSTRYRAGGVATLILPADACWSTGGVASSVSLVAAAPVDEEAVERAAVALRSGEPCLLLLGGDALRAGGLAAASRIANATGARLLAENAPARHERGAGIPSIERLPYFGEVAAAQLADVSHLILIGARSPVSFFAYPGKPSELTAPSSVIHDVGGFTALEALADLVAAGAHTTPAVMSRPELPTGSLTPERIADVVGALLPEGAIVSDEAITSGRSLPAATAGCPPHDWLCLTGGSIGQGMPLATGAAVACPDRPVINLQAEGSAMYTLQALWTQARESLDVTTVVLNNASYAILQIELHRTGAPAGPGARALLELPGLDLVSMSRGFGVPAYRATTAEELATQLRAAIAEPGPHLIEAMVVQR